MIRVLVIDECQDFREFARFSLERDGTEVIEARDALAGLQRSVEDAPDLVIVAESLSGIDGLEIVGQLARSPETTGVPVIVACDRMDSARSRSALAVGAAAVVERFLPLRDFSTSVRETFECARAALAKTPGGPAGRDRSRARAAA